ncbi:hypothetical protein IVIADoCa3_70 [Xanthomonas phage vB_Xar_IVIA-DoCa3]|uniref:Uncharacterized protein n=3 Tax=Nipunavirus TaxID=1982239 RepID=A0A2H4GY42_9CAUD|nr:hypothetical protein P6F31_gp70 [Xanthomonas phage vB_Xar_IVIA-DoCa3]ARB11141.1 hypothetical protein JG012_00073 [Pseudomonas phage JG012]UUW40309.1 hypothetical protein IVIADoCa3_70 [Xanthomonas phage vB_Xar_IVIA-DoCa3]
MIPRFPMSPEVAKAIMEEHERRRKAREQRKRAKLLAKELEAALRDEQGPAQPRAHWRYPYGIGAHAIALCALAAAAALGYWLTH